VAVLKREGYNEVSFVGDVVEFASNVTAPPISAFASIPQEVKKVVRALYRGLRYAKEKPRGTIGVIQPEWKVDSESPRGSYQADHQKRSTTMVSSAKSN